jgi:hypothetical protein
MTALGTMADLTRRRSRISFLQLWFKVENFPAAPFEIAVAEDSIVFHLIEACIQQRPLLFGEVQEAGLWLLFRTAQAQEPEDSGDSL